MIKLGYLCTFINPKQLGYITVAFTRPSKEDPEQKHFVSFSFCSPKDNYSKQKGRLIAESRLESKNVIEVNVRGSIFDVIDAAINKAVLEKFAPSWVVKAHKKNKIDYCFNVFPKGIKKSEVKFWNHAVKEIESLNLNLSSDDNQQFTCDDKPKKHTGSDCFPGLNTVRRFEQDNLKKCSLSIFESDTCV